MDDRNTLLSQDVFARAVQFIWREAEMLDRREYREWLELWEQDGTYVVPIDPRTSDFAATLNYAYDDHEMREKRVQRMTSGFSASASDAARTVRTVSRFTNASEEANTIEVRSAQILIAYKRGVSTIFAADLTHCIHCNGDELRLAQKVVRLIDSTDALNAIGFLL